MEEITDEKESSLITTNKDVEWTVEHEQILIEWADKAMCYRWLHSRSNMLYSTLNAWYTIPVIVISTLTGTANFAQERVPLAYQNYYVMIVGGFNILAGIITTIQQFLKITQLNEAHRVSSIAWDKFYRNIKIEIAKHPNERIHATQMLKLCKEEFDRLMETSPVIPDKIITLFKESFKKSDNYLKIIKPEICDVLVSTDNYRNHWYNEENTNKRIQEVINLQNSKEFASKKLEEKNNKIRLVEINTYFGDKYAEHSMLMKIIIFTLIPVIILAFLNNKGILPNTIYYILLVIISVIGGYFFWMRFASIISRDNMNYQEYDWYFDANSAPTGSSSSSDPWVTSNTYGTCIGDACCSNGMTYDASNNQCIIPTTTTNTTNSSTESFLTESMVNEVLTKKQPSKTYTIDHNLRQPEPFNNYR